MNAKNAKLLRKIAMNASTPGEPLRQLVQFSQIAYGVDEKGNVVRRHSVCAVNNPDTFRGRYRNLKSGRTIDRKRILVEKVRNDAPRERPTVTTPTVKPQKSWLQRMSEKFNHVFHRS